MGINIKKQTTSIPVKVGDVELKFHYTDESMTKVREELLKTQKEIGRIEGEEWTDREVEQAKGILKDALDAMFGDGAFAQLYEMTPSVIVILDYFRLIVDGVTEELDKLGIKTDEDQKTDKYLNRG